MKIFSEILSEESGWIHRIYSAALYSQGYIRFRLFWKYAEIRYFG